MAPMRGKYDKSLSHIVDVSDRQRARELYEYYQPKPSQSGTDTKPIPDKIACPDTALTAFCQLVVWRTGAQRAMLSVIDDTTQYFIAESSKTVDLEDTTIHAPGDDIWMGCSSFAKSGRICVKTLDVAPTRGEYPAYIIPDLCKSPLYINYPYVVGPPFIRFYAGVPLITKRGIPIGSLLIVDQKPREGGLTKEEVHFMGSMATTIMTHMDMARQVEEHRRGMKMSRGLAAFVEGRADIAETEMDTDTPDGEGIKVAGQFETGNGTAALANGRAHPKPGTGLTRGHSATSSTSSIAQKEKEYSAALAAAEREIMASPEPPPILRAPDSGSFSIATNSESVHSPAVDLETPNHEHKGEVPSTKMLFSRAANLIRETFEVDGGCVFYDAQKGFNLVPKPSPKSPLSRQTSYLSNGSGLMVPGDRDYGQNEGSLADSGFSELGEGIFSRSATDSRKAVEVLGFSTANSSSINGDEYPIPDQDPQSFIPFHQKALHTLLRRYPRGKLWTLDADVAITSSSEEDLEPASINEDPEQHLKDMERRKLRKARSRSDARFLARHFPGVRQLLFVPLWDSARSRWLSGCCVWSTEPTRILSKQVELAFLTAFGNSVMAECSRIDTEIANQKKGDFIGSISHELRSPLHGILASAEFLGEERLSAFVKGLVDTIDSCGRTLLDTINHILDFSKINHFEKTWQKNRRGTPQAGPRYDGTVALQRSEIPMMNLFAEVDISVVCEEVVESVFAGHVFQNITAQTFDMVPSAQKRMSDVRASGRDSKTVTEQFKHSQVPVILDVKMQNFNFTTQPGAFRRIIMNLLGNALKYTSHGYVHVNLETTESGQENGAEAVARSMVTLTVTDTGKGISSEFLRSKLFTPFTQENSLSSGTGLGLAIVKSIVSLLEGEIAIDSEVGRGTRVKVTLPLLREMPYFAGAASPKSAASLSRNVDQSIEALRSRVVGQTVSLYGFDLNTPDPLTRQMGRVLKESIATFLTEWYGLRVVPTDHNANIIVANDVTPAIAANLAYKLSGQRGNPIVLVLCSHSSRFDRSTPLDTTAKRIGFVAKPVGPLKLARALVQCLDGIPPVVTPNVSEPHLPAEGAGFNRFFEELSPTPHRAEMLDNSRMSADSSNARKAIEPPTPAPASTSIEFPFPVAVPVSKTHTTLPERRAPSTSDSPSSQTLEEVGSAPPSSLTPSPGLSLAPRTSKPRLLIVDDNIINLALLRTYMRKRAYDVVDEAENGLEAVNRFCERPDGYDIIFMDISMPILDGFAASRQIRSIESSRRGASESASPEEEKAVGGEHADAAAKEQNGDGKEKQKENGKKEERQPALIIALTGLASRQDQTEALSSGIDLFLTKPVAFREVGKLLDNWEGNR